MVNVRCLDVIQVRTERQLVHPDQGVIVLLVIKDVETVVQQRMYPHVIMDFVMMLVWEILGNIIREHKIMPVQQQMTDFSVKNLVET